MIRLNQLHEYIVELDGIIHDEKEWNFFLHKVYDKTFDDFKTEMRREEKPKMTKDQIKNVVDESASLIELF